VSQSERILIVGLGSAHGDDQAGWLVVKNLASQCQEYPDITVCRASIPLDLLDWIEGIDVLHICDACESTKSPAKLHRFRYGVETDELSSGGREYPDSRTLNAVDQEIDIPRSPLDLNSLRCRGTHDFGLPDVLRLAAATLLLPQSVIIWAIEGTDFQPQGELSEATRTTALEAANAIMNELRFSHA
jgi:Ni,Fe-hydrogenase maturation factor